MSTTTLERSDTTTLDHTDPTAAIDCGPCQHAKEHGWWGKTLGKAITHCRNCHRSWRSLREGHCAVCCAHFADPAAHEAHRRDGQCVDPSTVLKRDGSPRFKIVENAFGPMWDLITPPMTPERRAQLQARSTVGAGRHF